MIYPCISFQGNCNDAIAFYKEVLGAQVKSISHFKDTPADDAWAMSVSLPPDFVADSEVIIDGQSVMMTDGGQSRPTAEYFSFCLTKDTAEEVKAIFNKLAETGKVSEPLAPVSWASLYGVVEDKFGITWMVMTSN